MHAKMCWKRYLILVILLFFNGIAQAEKLLEFQVSADTMYPNSPPCAATTFRNGMEEVWILWETADPNELDPEIYLRILRNGKISKQFQISSNALTDINPTITAYNSFVYMGYESYSSVSEKFDIILVGERDGHSVSQTIEPEIFPDLIFSGMHVFSKLPLDSDRMVHLDQPVIVSSAVTNNHYPHMAADANGVIHIVWAGDMGSADTSEIYYRSFHDNGTFSPILQVNPTNNHFDGYPQISFSNIGEPLVTWQGFDGNDMEIYYRNVGPDVPAPVLQVTSNTDPDISPRISGPVGDTVNIVWENLQDGDVDIDSARINVTNSTLDLSPYTIVHSKSVEDAPALITFESQNIELIYRKLFKGTSKINRKNLGTGLGEGKDLPSDELLMCYSPFGLNNVNDDAIYLYQAEYASLFYIFIMCPESYLVVQPETD